MIPRAKSQPQLSFQFLFVAADTVLKMPLTKNIAMKNVVMTAKELAGVAKQQMPVIMLSTPTMREIHQCLKIFLLMSI